MSNPIPVNILSDDEDGDLHKTPLPFQPKKPRTDFNHPNPTPVLIIDDDPTPRKPSPTASTPSFVAETPMSEPSRSYVPIVRCTNNPVSEPQLGSSSSSNPKSPGVHGFICLESDNESEGFKSFPEKTSEPRLVIPEAANDLDMDYTCSKSPILRDNYCFPPILEDDRPQVSNLSGEEDDILRPIDNNLRPKGKDKVNTNRKGNTRASRNTIEEKACKPSPTASTPSFVAETPMSEPSKSYLPIVRCTNNPVSEPQFGSSSSSNPKSPGVHGLICLESDNESEGFKSFPEKTSEPRLVIPEVANDLDMDYTCSKSPILRDNYCFPPISEDDRLQVSNLSGEEDDILRPIDNDSRPKCKTKVNANRKGNTRASRNTIEEKARLMNIKKQQKEQEKLQKAAMKAQAAEMKKLQKEIQSWEKGKFAQQSIVAKIDTKVVEQGSVGGQLLTRLAEKGITFHITSNPVERSIIWTMSVPEKIAQALTRGTEIAYVLLVYEAEEFCRLVINESLMDHVSRIQHLYPSHTVCYLTNRLVAYINKREQEHYKNPSNHSSWKRPPVEEMLSKLTTHFVGVHSRLCADESELAEHVVGLTCSLASCQFRKKLTRLSVNANGSLIPKDADRALIKKSTWLKALIAIPKVQPRFAIAISKKYPTMKSLLSVYMDPTKSEHEKEFLLADLTTEGLVGDNRRLGEICSKRVYRILTAECGTIKTDDVENGADFFNRHSS